MAESAGLVVEYRGVLRFIPAAVAQRVVRRSAISRVAGSDLCITLFEGRVISVLELGAHRDELVVCIVNGEAVALAGLRVLASGFFDASDGGVMSNAGSAALLDVVQEVHEFERQLWRKSQKPGDLHE